VGGEQEPDAQLHLPDRSGLTVTIGLISDTHGLVRPDVANIFRGVSRILHAGDVGGPSVLAALNEIAPTEAVYGNVDDRHNPALRRELVVSVGGVTIHVSHGHELGRPTAELVAARYAPTVSDVSDTKSDGGVVKVLVFGHTHRAVIARLRPWLLVVNPGAAGPRRFDVQPTVARLTIAAGAADCEIISLA
jgi:uncharacterized protein